jgi:hypothetical protein
MSTLRFRRARAEDLGRLVAIHTAAYADPRGYDARVRNLTANALGTLDGWQHASTAASSATRSYSNSRGGTARDRWPSVALRRSRWRRRRAGNAWQRDSSSTCTAWHATAATR